MSGIVGPGDRITARCTRCNDLTGHIVIVVVGGEIHKVECLACKSVHKYYPPITPKAPKVKTEVCRVKPGQDRKSVVQTTTKAAPKAAPKTALAKKISKTAENLEQNWQKALNSSLASPKDYSMGTAFSLHDIVNHPKFGQGVVQSLEKPDKMHIMFRDGLRILRCQCG